MRTDGAPRPAESRARSVWPAVLVGVTLFSLVLSLWWILSAQDDREIHDSIQAESDYLAFTIEADLRNRLPALQRMASSWGVRADLLGKEFSAEATAYLADVPGFQALEWVDRDGIVRAVIPLEGNEKAVGLDLAFEKNRRNALATARDQGLSVVTPPVHLVQGGIGFLAIFPVRIRGEHAGALIAVLRVQEWLNYVFAVNKGGVVSDDFRVLVLFDGNPIYKQDGWEALEKNDHGIESIARMSGYRLQIRVRATDTFIRRNASSIPLLTVIFGGLLSLLGAFIVQLYLKSASDVRRANAAKTALEQEMQERRKTELELQRVSARIDWALKSARMGLWTWDMDTDALTWNGRMYELMSMPEDISPTYETWRNAIHPDDIGRVEPLLRKAAAGTTTFETEFRVMLPDGATRYIRAAARVERDATGRPKSMTGLNWDVSAAKNVETALRQSEEQVRLLLNSTGEAIYGIDMEGNCTFANPACTRMLGSPDATVLLGKNMHALIHHSKADGSPLPEAMCKIYQAFREGKPAHVDDEVLWRLDGTSFPAEYWSYPQIAKGAVHGAVVTFIDITERRNNEVTIRHMATHDGLTDLPTLRLYKDRLAMALGAGRRSGTLTAVIFLDLDGFKAVNDTYGHDAGDETLREVAKRVQATIRETDTVARAGGDEFLIAVTGLQTRDAVAQVARKILAHLAVPIPFKGRALSVGASLGIAISPDDSEDIDELIKAADGAMYEIKKDGKNGFRFSGGEIPA